MMLHPTQELEPPANPARFNRNPAKMQRKDVIRLRDANADKAYFANYSLCVLRVLMEHCVDLGWIDTNPARGVSELKTEKSEREPWPQELLDAYRDACLIGTRERLVMELCVGTGQRIGDVLEMRWSDIQDGAVFVRQSKTKERTLGSHPPRPANGTGSRQPSFRFYPHE
jgi:integrase